MNLPKKLTIKLQNREEKNALRILKTPTNLIDFSSNDYLGFAKSEVIFKKTHEFLIAKNQQQNGATGSRLISGNHALYTEVEDFLSDIHQSETATIFNSGYDANIGFFSSVLQRGDVVLYDELSHASIRDGIQLSNAKSYKFLHNNIADLEAQIIRYKSQTQGDIYVVTEAVFSMDGDTPNIVKITNTCKKHGAFLIVDEAHSVGVLGKNGCGIVQDLNLQEMVFARIVTFGKALGCHGAAILGGKELQSYLVNFARSFIYTTGMPPHSLATIKVAYSRLLENTSQKKLQENIEHFLSEVKRLELNFMESNSAIHCCMLPGNEQVKRVANLIIKKGFDVKAILSPTVPENKERLRFCLHAHNSTKEITAILENLAIFVNE